MKMWRFEKDKKKIEDNKINDVRNLFSLKIEIEDTTIKNVTNHFRLRKEINDTTVVVI